MASLSGATAAHPPPPGAIVLGLDRISALLKRLNDPHAKFPVIHVAGTNAKGTTTAYLDALLHRTIGLRTGRFNSPHLVTERDSCSLNAGSEIVPSQVWQRASAAVAEADNSGEALQCTPFELLTATAFQAFDLLEPDVRPEILVIEVGLGGRLDATNVLPARNVLASVICPIDMDHESLLGSTLQEIATAKGGIIKPGGLCILADQRRSEDSAQAGPNGDDDRAALQATTAVVALRSEATVVGRAASIIINTIAQCCRHGSSASGSDAPRTSLHDARIVRAHAPLHALRSAASQPNAAASSSSNSWQVRMPAKLTMTPTLCTPNAASQRYDDEDDFAEGGLAGAVRSTLKQLRDTSFVPDPAIHPEAYDDELEAAEEGHGPTSAAQLLLEHSPSYEVSLPATRAALSAASTALTTLHAIARDLPTLIPGSDQRDLHSVDPWEDFRLRIAYGLTAADAEDAAPTSRVQSVLERGVRWRGRCEWVKIADRNGEGDAGTRVSLDAVLLDGAHNPSSAIALREYLDACVRARLLAWAQENGDAAAAGTLPKVEVTWVMAFSHGKDVRSMLQTLLGSPHGLADDETRRLSKMSLGTSSTLPSEVTLTQRLGLCPFATPVEGMPWVRPAEVAEVARIVRDALPGSEANLHMEVLGSLEDALTWATTSAPEDGKDTLRLTVICGSLYLVGECYSLAEKRWTIEAL